MSATEHDLYTAKMAAFEELGHALRRVTALREALRTAQAVAREAERRYDAARDAYINASPEEDAA